MIVKQRIAILLLLISTAENVKSRGEMETDVSEVGTKGPSEIYWPQSENDCYNRTLLAMMDFTAWGK